MQALRRKIYGALIPKIHNEGWRNRISDETVAETSKLLDGSAIPAFVKNVEYTSPNKMSLVIGLDLDLDDDIISRNQTIILKKMRELSSQRVDTLNAMSLLDARLEIINSNSRVYYHECRFDIQSFITFTKFIKTLLT